MLGLEMTGDAGLDVVGGERLGRTVREKSGLHVLGRELADTSNHDLAFLFVPLKEGPGTDAEFLAYFGWYRNPALRRDLGPSEHDGKTLPG
jgi:hypothetical protein